MSEPVQQRPLAGAGLGLRRAFVDDIESIPEGAVDFIELVPENWIGVGGAMAKQLRAFSERYPSVLHGLSLNIGGFAPLDLDLVRNVGSFMREHGSHIYTDHLTYCGDEGHLYDLMPIPFTEEAVEHVAARIRLVQDTLGCQIAMENASYYAAPAQQMTELEFVNAVLEAADCQLLLDVNNIYVNSINHRYDPAQYLRGLPVERVAYVHIAGHFVEAEDLRVDTHGADVIDPVWKLLQQCYSEFAVFPTLLERDFNIPPMEELLAEVDTIRGIQAQFEERVELKRA